MTMSVRFTTPRGECVVTFSDHPQGFDANAWRRAWQFMRDCDSEGIPAGYPYSTGESGL